jgi:molybdopterin-synthase adenylyltransferase
LRVGVVGAGSVGALIAEALSRTGIERIRLIDFDSVETINLDRLLHATRRDVFLARSKVETLARGLRRSATAAQPHIEALEHSIVEENGLRAALDCDVLFSCVDRPWPRYVLNLVAYAHLIPVVDGGIAVERTARHSLRGANWRAHVAGPGRRCLECLEQYDAGLIQTERDGFFDDPRYIDRLPDDHPIKRNENVFAFAVSCAGLELNQFLSLAIAPGGVTDYGAQHYHLVSGTIDRDERECRDDCLFSGELLARGDHVGFVATGDHVAAAKERGMRTARQRTPAVRALRRIDAGIERLLF